MSWIEMSDRERLHKYHTDYGRQMKSILEQDEKKESFFIDCSEAPLSEMPGCMAYEPNFIWDFTELLEPFWAGFPECDLLLKIVTTAALKNAPIAGDKFSEREYARRSELEHDRRFKNTGGENTVENAQDDKEGAAALQPGKGYVYEL